MHNMVDIIQHIRLGMGEGIVAEYPCVLTSTGLGSCVALMLYDKERKAGGMAHIMLPYSGMVKSLIPAPASYPPFWFVDTAVYTLLDGLLRKGASLQNILAKAAGGAYMFPSYNGESERIGDQNVENIKGLLTAMHIPLAGWDVGGNHSRSVEFYLESGMVLIKTIGRKDKVL